MRDKLLRVTSVQHLCHIIASNESYVCEFILALNGGRSTMVISFSDQMDKNGEPKLHIYKYISGTRQVLTRESLEKKSLIGKAIHDGHFYFYASEYDAPNKEDLNQFTTEVSIFPEIDKQWLVDNTNAIQQFIEVKSKEFEGIVFTEEDVMVHEEGLVPTIGALWAQEYANYLPIDLVRDSECESVEQGTRSANPEDEPEPYGPYILTIRLWLAGNHSKEDVQQYMSSLNTEELAQTITAAVLPHVDLQKYLYLTQQKIGEVGAWARERAQRKKRKAIEEKDQMSFNFD